MTSADDESRAGRTTIERLLASGLIGLYTRDLRTGQARWDHSLFEMTGFDPALGAPAWETFLAHVHPDDRPALRRHYETLGVVPRRGDLHFRFCRPDGRVCLVHSLYDVHPGSDGAPQRVTGVMIDDSHAGRLLEAGARSRDFLQQALTASGVSVWFIDLDARVVRFDAASLDILGLGAGRGAPVPLEEFRQRIHPDDRPGIEAAAEAALREDRIVDAVARYRTAEGQWRALLTRRIAVRDGEGRAQGLMGVALDLGGREGEQARAEMLADRSRLVAQAMDVGFWQRDADGQALLWDEQMYRLYGRDPLRPPPTLDEWLDGYVLPEARDEARRRLHEDMANWAPETVLTLPVRAEDGTVRWIRAWTRRREHGGRRSLLGMHQDVTEQRRLSELQQEAERAARASREKSAFMSTMSHRLRTPLNAVLGFAQLLMQDAAEPLSPRQRERLMRIDAAGQELLEMLDEVFELAGLEAGDDPARRVPVAFDGFVDTLREATTPLARQRGVTLRFGAVPSGVQLATDRRLLGQALRHLLAHAVRRNGPGGQVDVACGVAGDAAWLDLRDDGPRLDARQRELLFEPVPGPVPRAAHGDTHVGLDLVRQALDRLGVRLSWLEEPADGPAVLRVGIPLATVPVAAADPISLLCIEDNPVNLMLVRELVGQRPRITFRSAEDGRSGLEAARSQPPDVVLLDLNLPDMDGREVLAGLRADPRTAACHVIALSASVLPDDLRGAREQGFDDYWTKPIDFDRFLAGLDALASRRRG